MYTQCPECQIAFRVTAKVLQQADGHVRCGSCEHAFNALHYLSEEMPESAADPEPEQDELAETSRKLLETLDELAGPEDVRIEDTGVEWRVLDIAEAEANATDAERRYDDNSPLPDEFDDFDFDQPPVSERHGSDEEITAAEDDEHQADLALSEPEEWADILEEVRDPGAEVLIVAEELAAIQAELSTDDEDEPVDVDVAGSDEEAASDDDPDYVVEADGDEEPVSEEEAEAEAATDEDREEDAGSEEYAASDEIADGDEVADSEEYAAADDSADSDEDAVVFVEDFAEEPVDLDTQFETQAEALGIEPEPVDELTDEVPQVDEGEYDPDEDPAEDDVETGSPDSETADDEEGEEGESAIEQTPEVAESDEADENSIEQSTEAADSDETEEEVEDEEELRARESGGKFEAIIDLASRSARIADEPDDETEPDGDAEPVEDENLTERFATLDNPEEIFDESSGEVETIIMEGDLVRSGIGKNMLAAGETTDDRIDTPASFAESIGLSQSQVHNFRRLLDPSSVTVLWAIGFLALILAGQLIHNSRESLATLGFFRSTIAPVYRVLGSPVTPAWNVRGWQFEVTNGSVNEEASILTIESRIGNRAEEALPLPLVHVSLTNRFEDVTGSRILKPEEYLADGQDPALPVQPGENFMAVINVDNPPAEATGFKLNVCYRVEEGTVRCAIEDFK